MKVIVLAAGYGTRLYPLTKDIPKPLLKIGKEPLINHLIKKVSNLDGLDEIVVVTNQKFFETFQGWLKDNKNKLDDAQVNILNDGTSSPEARLGAIGDVFFVIKHRNIKEDTLVVGGDNVFDFDLGDFIKFAKSVRPSKSVGLVNINDINKAKNYGVAELDKNNRIISFEEKPKKPKSSLVAMCLYYLPKESLSLVSAYMKNVNMREEKDASGAYIRWLHKEEDVFGYVFEGQWYDIGHIDSYREVQDIFK